MRSFGWRMPFYVSAVPGLLIAVLILFLMKEPARGASDAKPRAELGRRSGGPSTAHAISLADQCAVSVRHAGDGGDDVFAGRDFGVDAELSAAVGILAEHGGADAGRRLRRRRGWAARRLADGWRSAG